MLYLVFCHSRVHTYVSFVSFVRLSLSLSLSLFLSYTRRQICMSLSHHLTLVVSQLFVFLSQSNVTWARGEYNFLLSLFLFFFFFFRFLPWLRTESPRAATTVWKLIVVRPSGIFCTAAASLFLLLSSSSSDQLESLRLRFLHRFSDF